MFIVIEGADASGKATQAKLLADRFLTSGHDVLSLAFPRYNVLPLGEALKARLTGAVPSDPLALQCMMTVDRYDAAADICAHLDEDYIVIADRWWQAGYAYGLADGLPSSWLVEIHLALPPADCNFYIEVPLAEAQARRPAARDLFEADLAKQAAVRKNYRALWEDAVDDEPQIWRIIDGVGTANEVHERIWTHIREVMLP